MKLSHPLQITHSGPQTHYTFLFSVVFFFLLYWCCFGVRHKEKLTEEIWFSFIETAKSNSKNCPSCNTKWPVMLFWLLTFQSCSISFKLTDYQGTFKVGDTIIDHKKQKYILIIFCTGKSCLFLWTYPSSNNDKYMGHGDRVAYEH